MCFRAIIPQNKSLKFFWKKNNHFPQDGGGRGGIRSKAKARTELGNFKSFETKIHTSAIYYKTNNIILSISTLNFTSPSQSNPSTLILSPSREPANSSPVNSPSSTKNLKVLISCPNLLPKISIPFIILTLHFIIIFCILLPPSLLLWSVLTIVTVAMATGTAAEEEGEMDLLVARTGKEVIGAGEEVTDDE